MVVDDIEERGEQIGRERGIAGRGLIGADREDVPECGVGGVVTGDHAGVIGEIFTPQCWLLRERRPAFWNPAMVILVHVGWSLRERDAVDHPEYA